MVSLKFWRGKFSRPATGYECIAHALAFDRGLDRLKAGVNVKAVFTSLNTAFLPISRSRFKRRQIPMLITLSTIWQFCVNFWVIFRCFGKERFFLKG